MFANDFLRTCKKVIEEPGLIERLRAENFDVYITENFDICGIGKSRWFASFVQECLQQLHTLSPRRQLLDLHPHFSSVLISLNSELKPQSAIDRVCDFIIIRSFNLKLKFTPGLVSSNVDIHSVVSRFWNVYAEIFGRLTFWYQRHVVNNLMKEHFGKEYPTIAVSCVSWIRAKVLLKEQSSNVAYVLTNSEPLSETAAPTTARVINVPDIGTKTAKPLDEV